MLLSVVDCFFFFKQKTAYEMRIIDWSSDVCSSDLAHCATISGSCSTASTSWPSRSSVEAIDEPNRPSPITRTAESEGGVSANDGPLFREPDDKIGRASCRERVWQYG